MIVLLIVADSLKAETPGYAGGRANTPFLDRLTAEGARFEHAFASAAWTIPSLMSMLTGALGHRIGICRWRHPYPSGRPNLLTAFAAAGFETMCFHPYPQWGFLTIPGRGVVGNSQDPAAVARALRGGGDRFALIHHWWTHLPYLNRELSIDKWQGVCDFALQSLRKHPAQIGRRLEESHRKAAEHFSENVLPSYLEAAAAGGGRVLTVVTADHGETWGRSLPPDRRVENVYDLHGRWIADETIRVPLIFHGETADGRAPAGQVLGGFARGVDLGPTIAELAGVPWPGPTPAEGAGLIERPGDQTDTIGQSLASCVMEARPSPHAEAPTISSQNTHVPRTFPALGVEMWRTTALRTTDAWFIWDGVDGRGEVKAIGDNAPADGDAVFARLEAVRRQAVDSGPLVPEKHVERLRKEGAPTDERLRALGYLD